MLLQTTIAMRGGDMTIKELIAEELSKDPRTDPASEPLQVTLDAEGEVVIRRGSGPRTRRRRTADPPN